MSISPDDSILVDLRVEDISAFVNRLGWRLIQHPNDRLLVFEGPLDDDNQPIDLVLPRRNDFVDTPRRLVEAINLLAVLLDQPVDEVIHSIHGLDRKGGHLRIRVHLEPDDYRIACDAHRDGLSVSVTGRLEKLGKYWILMSPHHFKVYSI